MCEGQRVTKALLYSVALNISDVSQCFWGVFGVFAFRPTSISITPSCPAFSEARKDQNGSALVSSAKQKILIPTGFWAQQLSGTFTHVESRYCNKDIMPLGEGLSLPELPQACLPLVWNKIIKIWYTFLEILPNLNLPRCHHLNADCRTSSEVHWI